MKKHYTIALMALVAAGLVSCEKGESYADLLKKEEKAINWYLSGEAVEVTIPEDGNFEVGEDAPYYRMDSDGNVYMQVLNMGDPDDKPEKGDRVYFRYSRMNLRNFYEADVEQWVGNSNSLNTAGGATSFILGNLTLSSSYQFGSGIQVPLDYLGYNSRVRLVLRAQAGFYAEQSECLPFVYDVRYFKGVY
ncbi:MAG: DUF4827 family protein [Muribaculaceae bacterium]|nr:DUF4827 family protein [Muribaculaceae bacterium]